MICGYQVFKLRSLLLQALLLEPLQSSEFAICAIGGFENVDVVLGIGMLSPIHPLDLNRQINMYDDV